MQLLIDFFPLLLFFVAYLWQGIYVATAVAIVASVAQIVWIHWKHGRAGVTQWLSLVIIVVFGGATLLLQDKTFIMWKPTVLYGLFGTILAVGKLAFGRDLLAHVMKGVVLPAAVWTRLTWAWVAFFAFMGLPTGTWPSTTPSRRGCSTRSGAVSGSSWCSRSCRDCGFPATCPRRPHDAAPDTARRTLRERLQRSRRRSSRSTTTAPSTSAMPAPPAAPGTFRC